VHVVVAGGGSAGHISPALALADALRRGDPGIGITALGTSKGLETSIVPERGYDLELIPAVPLPRRPTKELISVPGRLAGTVKRAEQILEQVNADVVVGFGGYVALPAYLAARRRGVPIVVHEQNVRPGLANRIGARLTTHVATSYPDVKLRHATRVGLPLGRAIATLDRDATRAEARAFFGLAPDLPTLLISGGSQGARRLNETIAGAADAVFDAGVQVLHAVGPRNVNVFEAPHRDGGPAYVALPYVDRMDLAYAAADFMLARAGANTCAELAAVGLPACYVPLPIGNGEQRLNALPTVRAGGGLRVDDADLTPEWLAANVLPLLGDAERLGEMAAAAAAHGRRDADEALAAMVYQAAGVPMPGTAVPDAALPDATVAAGVERDPALGRANEGGTA
jgi:UDP-N-acetylglucosamine--N-acetylmuramyl-(pentapeptide) pyrophosphoryl-undecaprenol N-acetylglucosamine transferase